MDDKKNIILAVLLTAAILFGWPYVSHYFFPAANPPATKIEGGKTTPVAAPGTDTADGPATIRDRAIVLKESPRVPIRTPKLTGSINLRGARIDDIVLPTYRETIDKASPPSACTAPAARLKPISPASAGRAKGSRRRTRTRSGPPRAAR